MTTQARVDRFLSPPGDAVLISSVTGLAMEVAARVAKGETYDHALTEVASREVDRDDRIDTSYRAMGAHPETPLHAIADDGYKAVLVAVKYALARGRKAARKPASGGAAALQRAFADVPKAVGAALAKTLPTALGKVAARGARHTVGKLKGQSLRAAADVSKPPFALTFNDADPRAVAWAKEHAGELIDDIEEATLQAIKDAIASAVEDGDPDGAYDDVLDAIGDESRAETIARTEIMTAANEGQRMGWDASVEAGLLPEDAKKTWIATEVGACPECEALDGETVGLDEEYPNDGGDGPPLHPNCRCTEGIVGE